MDKQKVIVIGGPTASGKTELGIEVAKCLNGEVISADSMQIYQEMNIGTAKPTMEEMQGIKHYLLDFVHPQTRYSVADYKKDAMSAIKEIQKKGKTPIIVGGTGLYIDSLVQGIDYPQIDTDMQYRHYLEEETQKIGLEKMYQKALEIDQEAAERISKTDQKRILRILELYHTTGKTKTQLEIESKKNGVAYDYKVFAIDIPREILYGRINQRVDQMIEKGLIQEVEQLCQKYGTNLPTAMQGIGYKEVVLYLQQEISKEEMIETIKQESRRYAKRQMTWFRKNRDIIWIDGLESIQNKVQTILEGIK